MSLDARRAVGSEIGTALSPMRVRIERPGVVEIPGAWLPPPTVTRGPNRFAHSRSAVQELHIWRKEQYELESDYKKLRFVDGKVVSSSGDAHAITYAEESWVINKEGDDHHGVLRWTASYFDMGGR